MEASNFSSLVWVAGPPVVIGNRLRGLLLLLLLNMVFYWKYRSIMVANSVLASGVVVGIL